METENLWQLFSRHLIDHVDVHMVPVVALWEPIEVAHYFVLAVGVVRLKYLLRQEIFK